MTNKSIADVAEIPCPGCGLTGIGNLELLTLICTGCGSPRVPVDPDGLVFAKRPAEER